VDLSVVPDITLQGESSPYAVASARPTVGRLSAVAEDLVARPSGWWHLVRFDGTPVLLSVADDIEARLVSWPPGFQPQTASAPAPVPEVISVIAGELSIAGRPLRPNRIRVRGGLDGRELVNHGPGFAISLHVRAIST
jgi:hypothetical protein